MPFKSKNIVRLCKYCPRPAVRNIQPGGLNKGYYRTCGSDDCLRRQYKDPGVNERKRFRGKTVCENCAVIFISESARQKWCKACAPNKSARRILQRYGLTPIEHKSLLDQFDGACHICLNRKAIFVDHDHKTNRVRGALCGHCNAALPIVEDQRILARAIKYILNIYEDVTIS